jgi:hypothetical protein
MPVVLYDTSQLHPGELLGIVTFETQLCARINSKPLSIKGGNTMPFVSFDLYAGSNRRLRVFVKDDNLDIVNLTGATCVFTMRHTKDDPIVVQKSTAVPGEGQIGAADEGECFFYLVPADTSALDICQYVFDVSVTLASGDVYKATVEGVINLMQPVG